MIGFFEISIVVLLAVGVLAGLVYGIIKAWDAVVAIRRRHRLERESDEREHQRLLAQDYAEIMNTTPGVTPLSFTDYALPVKRRRDKKEIAKNE